MADEQASQEVAATETSVPAGSGINFIIISPDKVDEIVRGSTSLMETALRHQLDLARIQTAVTAARTKPGDGCCNCVFC